MTTTQMNTTKKIASRDVNYHLLVQASSTEFTEKGIRNIFEKYGKIKNFIPISYGKKAQLTYENFSEAVAALQGVHDKPPLKLQVDYYKKDDDFISRYEYTHCRITAVDPIKRMYRVRRVKDEKDYKKFQEKLQEASNKCSETIDVDKLVVGNVYSIMYCGVWKRGKISSINPIRIDLMDDGETLKSTVQITSYKKIGKLEDRRFSGCLKMKDSPDNENKDLRTGSYVEVRMIGKHENMNYVVRKSDEIMDNNINNKSTSSIENIKTSTQKDNVESKSNKSTDILPSDICIFDSFEPESSIEISISGQIDSTTATAAVFLYTVKEPFQLLDKLNEHCNQLVQSYNNYKPSINEYICFKQSGHINWYRGIVLSAGESIKVASLDQGIETTAHKIIPVPDMFKNIPALAVQIKTHDKFPYSIGNSANLIICDIDKELKTVFARFKNFKINSEVKITQWTPWINNEKSIEDVVIVHEKLPTAIINSLNAPRDENVNSTIVEKENIVIPVIEKCSSTVNENPAPKIDKKIIIKDFDLKNNSQVVVQSYLGPSVICIAGMGNDDVKLKQTFDQEICDTVKTSELIDNPNVGDYVLARYNGNNYYRAKVLSICDKKIVADFIDFGVIEIIKPGNIKKMSESLMKYPSLMKQVTLKNVDNNPPTKEAANYIKTLFATEEILICSFDDNLPDKVELKTLDNKSVNDEINKLLKKFDDEKIIPIIPKPKPQLRLNNIKREELNGIAARKNTNKIESSKIIEETSQSELAGTKSTEELSLKRKLTTETSSNTISSTEKKAKLTTETSSDTISSTETTEKKIKLTESSKKPESIDNEQRSSRKSSKEKSPESKISSSSSTATTTTTTTSSLKKRDIPPTKPYRSYPRCTEIYCSHCKNFTHYTEDCRVLKRKRNHLPRRLENNYDSSRYDDYRFADSRNHVSIRRSNFDNPRHGRVGHYFDE
ncbi:hypothetical protein HCN44_002978 [Aphidius gifuensis]|uniref:Tudor domain-containing protein n=1 Tax=Aphidius gifuensis TaxID=684658 RepID=A0A834XSK1_APHGI|nr:uncharacterized protein LOC122853674 [Aphidius gifuensis]KAF7991416.1 hypothetical protein HCN44_002978 [Aphidius gifuensis]